MVAEFLPRGCAVPYPPPRVPGHGRLCLAWSRKTCPGSRCTALPFPILPYPVTLRSAVHSVPNTLTPPIPLPSYSIGDFAEFVVSAPGGRGASDFKSSSWHFTAHDSTTATGAPMSRVVGSHEQRSVVDGPPAGILTSQTAAIIPTRKARAKNKVRSPSSVGRESLGEGVERGSL